MYCTSCGKQMPDDAKFCPSCGHVVGEPVPEEQEPEQPEGAQPEQPEAAAPSEPPPSVTPPVGPAYQPTVPGSAPAQPPAPEQPVYGESVSELAAAHQPTVPGSAPAQPAAPEPTPPAAATPPPQPTPTPAPAAAQPTPPPVQPTPQPAPPTQVPPTPPAAPPVAPPTQPAGVPPTAEAPKKGGGKCWLIGCGILLLVGIIIAVVGTFMCARGAKQIGQGLQNTIENLPTNSLEIREPGEEGAGGISDIIEGLGEAAGEIGAAASAVNIQGFEPSSVDASMLPMFYGFLYELAENRPTEMLKYMSPSFKEQWEPWEPDASIEHHGFRMQTTNKVSNDEYEFVITEHVRDSDEDREGDISWYITFSREGGKWSVTSFE